MELHSLQPQEQKKKKKNVLSDLRLVSLHHFPSAQTLPTSCSHRTPVCRPSQKQTHLAHIPPLCSTRLLAVSEAVPESAASLHGAFTPRHKQDPAHGPF